MTHPLAAFGLTFAGFVAIWLAKGAHRGLTRDTEFRREPDEVTGLVALIPTPVWIPGIDFVLIGALVAAGVALACWMGRRWGARRSRRIEEGIG